MFGLILVVISVIAYFLILNADVKNKGSVLMEKTITALLSTLIFSLIFAISGYTPLEEQDASAGYESFGGLFGMSIMLSLPLFLICGGLYCFVADIYLGKISVRHTLFGYVISILVYLAGGFLIAALFFAVLSPVDWRMNELLLSVLAIFKISVLPSLLFFHISLFTKKVLNVTV